MRSLLKNKTWLLFLVGLIVIGVVVKRNWPKTAVSNSQTATVKYRNIIQRVTIAGKIVSKKQTVIKAPYNGYVSKIYVEVGQRVKKGAPIVSVAQSLQSTEKIYPIKAPYAGVVVSIAKSEGEYVASADAKNYIVKIDDLSQMYVQVDVPEIEITKMKVGQKVTIKATPVLDRTYRGIIETISLASKPETGGFSSKKRALYPARIRILDQDKQLRPDMSAIVDIIIHQKKHILTLRHEYIHKKNNRYFVIMKDGERRDVKLGIQSPGFAEILSGLKSGDEVRKVDYMKARP